MKTHANSADSLLMCGSLSSRFGGRKRKVRRLTLAFWVGLGSCGLESLFVLEVSPVVVRIEDGVEKAALGKDAANRIA